MTSATNASLVAAANAGFSSLVTQAVTALVGNGGDIGAALQQLGSSATLKNLATSMITAGLLESVPLDGLTASTDTLTGTAKQMTDFTNNLKVAMAQGTISATVDSVINGAPLGDNIKAALVNAAITVIGAESANAIGAAATDGNINKATQLIAHAALGCGMGAASGGDCTSGAVGGVVGEVTAWGYQSMTSDELQADILTLGNTASSPQEADE